VAAQKGLVHYLQVKLDGQSLSTLNQSDLLLGALSLSRHVPEWKSRLEVVSFLLEQGVDPNMAIESGTDEEGSTVWVYFLINYKSRKLDTYDIIRALLIHGADLNASVSGTLATDAVREMGTEDEARELAPILPWVPMPKTV
jgi:ankyrin repeat protein